MKVSFIIWDGNFREYLHTLNCFENQTCSSDKFEVIWCDFYTNTNSDLAKIIEHNDNFHLVNLGNDANSPWNEGKCINNAVSISKTDVVALIDGDIYFDKDFVSKVIDMNIDQNKAVYLRRYDEKEIDHHPVKSYSIDYLEKVCELNNPFNYAAFLCLGKSLFNKLQGYETHKIFDGPGGASIDMHTRLLNSGAFVATGSYKIYHPWHPSTGQTNKYQQSSILFSKHYKWINGYIGVKQSWIIKRRQENLSFKSSSQEVDLLLRELNPRLLKKPTFLSLKLILNRFLRRFGI